MKALFAALALFATLSGTAQAQDAKAPPAAVVSPDVETENDLRCLVVAFTLASSTDPNVRQAGLSAGFYYLGRLDGRAPDLDLENRIFEEEHHLSPEQVTAERQRCGQFLMQRGGVITQMGQNLEARERQESQTSHP